jgi:hypothetical protein
MMAFALVLKILQRHELNRSYSGDARQEGISEGRTAASECTARTSKDTAGFAKLHNRVAIGRVLGSKGPFALSTVSEQTNCNHEELVLSLGTVEEDGAGKREECPQQTSEGKICVMAGHEKDHVVT